MRFQIEKMILFNIGWFFLLLGTVRSQECFPEIIDKTFIHVDPTVGPELNTDSPDDCMDVCINHEKCLAFTFEVRVKLFQGFHVFY